MTLLNYYSLAHLLIWFLAARYTKIGWPLFLILSIGWEGLEFILPFDFAREVLANKLADIAVNVLAFYLGKRWNSALPQNLFSGNKPDLS